ncbi:MAG: DUF808 domain-containing protein [Burkholderiales bacterium]|nr:DUF808 domain-containing protein [Burkholderiales bacterium]
MPAASLLALVDDIASVLDDVALLSKAAAKQTAGVVGDDLALNAQQLVGLTAERELPVVWAVARGSLLNKAILVPLALALAAFAPVLVTPLLMIGGLYLCFEGAEKLAQPLLHRGEADAHRRELAQAAQDPQVDLVQFERERVRGAIRTDFVLSAEIIAIALGTVAGSPLATQALVLTLVALVMTAGVYGLVAAIVKLDDLGLWLTQRRPAPLRAIGARLLLAAPRLMKGLTVVGTVAMFMVGGGILAHGIPPLRHAIESTVAPLGAAAAWLLPTLAQTLLGLLAGALAVAAVAAFAALRRPRGAAT